MKTIKQILTSVEGKTTPAAFVGVLPDDGFDGKATSGEMYQLVSMAQEVCRSKRVGGEWAKRFALTELVGLCYAKGSEHFKGLNLNTVIYQLVIRILKPWRIHQNSFGLCGPCHFAVLMIKTQPQKYARIAKELFTQGRSKADGWHIEPHKQILEYDPASRIPQADWLVAASIRNSKGQIPLNPDDCGKYSNTKPQMMFEWLRRAGYTKILGSFCSQSEHRAVDWASRAVGLLPTEFAHPKGLAAEDLSPLRDPERNLKYACHLSAEGWKILMTVNEGWAKLTPAEQIDFSGVEDPKTRSELESQNRSAAERREGEARRGLAETLNRWSIVPHTNHWIYVKSIAIDSANRVKMTRYTWGDKKETLPLSLEVAVRGYGGFFAVSG